MAWKETCPMTERLSFLQEALRRERTMAEVCEVYGISRKTAYKWLARYHEGGEPALADRSHAPLHQVRAVGADLVEQLVRARQQHPTWGPRKLLAWLGPREEQVAWPVASTVGQILRRHGLVIPRRRRPRVAHRSSAELVQPYAPNVVWCTDFKGQFRTSDHRYCYPLTMTDAFSRYLLTCHGGLTTTTEHVRPVFERAFRHYGLPLVMRSDNGPPFASNGLAGLSRLSVWWIKLGIVPERITPGHPQENGRHERMHRTLKQATTRPAAATLQAQQRVFDAFVQEFNEQRPHEALAQRPPATAYQPSPRQYPRRIPPVDYPDRYAVRQVRQNGEIKFLGQLLYITEALIGEPVGLLQIEEYCWRVHFSSLPIALLDTRTMKFGPLDPMTQPSQEPCGGAAPPAPFEKMGPKTSPKVSPIRPV